MPDFFADLFTHRCLDSRIFWPHHDQKNLDILRWKMGRFSGEVPLVPDTPAALVPWDSATLRNVSDTGWRVT